MKTRSQIKRLQKRRLRKCRHVRARLRRESTRPRLCVFRSHKNISAQIIDDLRGTTLASASSQEKAFAGETQGKVKSEVAALIGKALAERAREKGVTKVAFDRGCYKFHGRIKALADAAREGGLEF